MPRRHGPRGARALKTPARESPRPRRRAPGTALLAAALLATAPAGASAQSDDAELRFTPRLVHYSLRCHTEQQCRFECFQGGESVVSRIGIGRRDAVRLAANVGIGETIAPLWIEIRPHESGDVQTVLLDRHTVCDFQSMTIEPFEAR